MEDRFPFPHDPVGWFCVGALSDLAPGALRSLTIFGRPVVLFRGASGAPGLVDAFCPHMGAHMGQGGVVAGEHLRCPFHHFDFDTSGVCVATPYDGGAPPPGARARAWPLQEKRGLLFAWHHPEGGQPLWALPAVPGEGWTAPALRRFDVRSHPQEISENSVDVGHFGPVHKYRGFTVVKPLEVDGPVLRTTYAFLRSGLELGIKGEVRFEIRIEVHGLGISTVDLSADRTALRARQYVLPTPSAPGRTDLRIGMQTKRPDKWSAVSPPLGLLPAGLAERIFSEVAIRLYAREVAQDLAIWENKVYQHPPMLARGDGPVGRYRAWCRQFYPALEGVR